MARGTEAGFAVGTLFYIAASLLLEIGIVPFFVSPNTPRLPYIQEAIVYILVSGGLGAIGGQLIEWLKSGESEKSVFLGLSIGSSSLFLAGWRCVRSTPPQFSVFNPSNMVLFGPLIIISIFLIALGVASWLTPQRILKYFSKTP